MKIGFDLDRIFIKYPPLVPARLIDWLYKNHNTQGLSYRIPTSKLEIAIRKTSHLPFLRQPIRENVDFVRRLAQTRQHQLYLISSRYDFLEAITHQLLKRCGLNQIFSRISLNTQNQQPHLFKESIIRKYGIELYIDDDAELLRYLAPKFPRLSLIRYLPGVSLKEHFRKLQNSLGPGSPVRNPRTDAKLF